MHERIRRIVVGIAEPEDGDPQLDPALQLAERVGAVVHLVHAFPCPDPILAPDLEGSPAPREEAQARLEPRARESPAREIVCHAVPGSPAEAIVGITEKAGGDLIIVGASRRSGLASAILGTTAQRVVRASPVPVLVNRRPGSGAPRRILLTTDLSELSARVHEAGIAIVSTLWDVGNAEVRSLLVAGDDVLLPAPGARIAIRQRAEAGLDAFLRGTPSGGAGVEGRVRLGLSDREILAEAAEWDADLVVLGTRGRTGLSRFLIGSVAETVSRKAACDVLLIPAS